MTNYSILFAFFLTVTSISAQPGWNWNEPNWQELGVGFACGAAGTSTEPVTNILEPFLKKDFDSIRKSLNSNLASDQFLAVFLLEHLAKKKDLELSQAEFERITEIKSSTDSILVCSGCTYFKEEPLSQVLKESHRIYFNAEIWFKTYYKMYYKKQK